MPPITLTWHQLTGRAGIFLSSIGGLLAVSALCAAADSPLADSTRVSDNPKFGDSSWVAPNLPPDANPGVDPPVDTGPRVQSPDHERTWETVLRTPFRLVFLPLRLVSRGLETGFAQFGDGFMEPKPPQPGLHLGLGIYAGSANDVALGPAIGYRGWPTDDASLKLFLGWSYTDHRRIRLSETIGDRKPVGLRFVGSYDLKPNRRFYGIGNDAKEDSLSRFLLEDTSAELGLSLGAHPLHQFRVVVGYSGMSARRGWNGQPQLEYLFSPESVPGYGEASYEFLYGVTADMAALDHDLNPSFGLLGHAELRHAMGIRSKDPDYNQWLFEGRGYLPVFASRRVIAVRGIYSGVDPTGATTTMPFYRLPHNVSTLTFAGYPAFRFFDNRLALLRAEYRWTLCDRQDWQLSAIALYELTEVAPLASAFTWEDRHHAYGGGFRLGISDRSTIRFEVAKSVEALTASLQFGNGF